MSDIEIKLRDQAETYRARAKIGRDMAAKARSGNYLANAERYDDEADGWEKEADKEEARADELRSDRLIESAALAALPHFLVMGSEPAAAADQAWLAAIEFVNAERRAYQIAANINGWQESDADPGIDTQSQ